MSKSSPKAPAELVSVMVLSTIYDGEMREIGQVLELAPNDAHALVDAGAAEYLASDTKPAR